ncbi:MAG: AAA family ATPase [Proteobacteria bacterium]|nr:AAA family ATPase [Pseudomonadota bacterium]
MTDSSRTRPPFLGSGRFELERQLGAGGMGVVYLARDREREQQVAIKALARMSPMAILRFKREFRALADVVHRNLVGLYELHCVDDRWFFTMEFVPGIDLATRCKISQPLALADGSTELMTPGSSDDIELPALARPPALAEPPAPAGQSTGRAPARLSHAGGADFNTIRDLMAQLAEGIGAIHASGHLHCDIKPSNTVVSDGRVVLLDFGLVTAAYAEHRPDEEICGTPAFMSMEQVRGVPLTPAADWYSFGVMLYELLTGRLPRPKNWLYNYVASRQPPYIVPPRTLNPDIPPDLSELCLALLEPDPLRRPPGDEIITALERRSAPRQRLLDPDGPQLFGRAAQLAALRQALDDTRAPATQVVYVSGDPGMGKTALVHEFLAPLRGDPSVVVLAGRCYQRETVPYKALDSLIDALSAHLNRLDSDDLASLCMPDVPLLSRFFPVLSRTPGFAGQDQGPLLPAELRRRAVVALVGLLTRIAARCRLVLFIDDLQWGDRDSLPFLGALIRQFEAPILLIIAHRSGQADRALPDELARMVAIGVRVESRLVRVGLLNDRESGQLAGELLLRAGGDDSVAPRLAAESGGDPLFLHALVAFSLSSAADARGASLADVLTHQLAGLEDLDRSLLELLSVAAQPLPEDLARRALDVDGNAIAQMIARLQIARLVRVRDTAGARRLEPYHDRIRDCVFDAIDAGDRAAYNGRLARAAAAADDRNPELLAEYYAGAGEHERAARFAIQAARNAAHALSFGHAASLLERALELGRHTRDARRELLVELGVMHKAAGDGVASAHALLAAAALSEGWDADDLRRQAAGEQIRNGYVDEGWATIAKPAHRVGLRMPRGFAASLAHMLYLRARLRLRGLKLKPADPAVSRDPERAARQRLRLSMCIELATGLLPVEPLAASAFALRALLDALNLGDRRTAMHACQMECMAVASQGDFRRAEQLIDFVHEQADLTVPAEVLMVASARTMLTILSGKFWQGYTECEQTRYVVGASLHEERYPSSLHTYEILGVFASIALLYSLDGTAIRRAFPAYLTEAAQSGNRYVLVMIRIFAGTVFHAINADVEGMYRHTSEALAMWNVKQVGLPHFAAALGQVWADLASREPIRAVERIRAQNGRFARGLLFHIELVRITWTFFRGLAHAAVARRYPERARASLRRARRDLRRLRRERAVWTGGLIALLDANIAGARGDRDRAEHSLDMAAQAFDADDLPFWAAFCRWIAGHVVDGPRGAAIRAVGERYLTEHSSGDIAFTARIIAPALVGERSALLR